MDIQEMKELVNQIEVRTQINADVEVINPTPLDMLGKGRQGAVFNVNNDMCVKVFGNTEDCDREYYALGLGQQSNLFPRVYDKGPLYIAMEIIRGVDLREYLQSQPLTLELSAKLIEMLITFKQIGFERIDHHKRQIYVQSDGSLKVIDVARTVWRDRVYPYPRKLLNSLGEENKNVFLQHVQELAPDLYNEWQHYIRMEELSREIYQLLISGSKDKEKVKKFKSLLTTKAERTYVTKLEGLMHKVFKEEWIKTMLARGYDIDRVMAQIDEYWDSFERKNQDVLDYLKARQKRERGKYKKDHNYKYDKHKNDKNDKHKNDKNDKHKNDKNDKHKHDKHRGRDRYRGRQHRRH